MAIKDLLVAYDGNEASRKAVELAVQMARKYKASITGLHIYQSESYESHVKRWIPEDVLARVAEARVAAEKSIGVNFKELLEALSYRGTADWQSKQGRANELIPRYSRYFDLLLIGQFTSVFESSLGSTQPEDIVMRSGKPIVIVPKEYDVRPFKGTAAIAWDGSRSAARALTDAMQILETKERLDVITIDLDGAGDPTGMPEGFDIMSHLTRHGITANKILLKARKTQIGDTILDHCAKTAPDVLVMGAYGRRKFGTLLFGGVTRHILQHMNVPVLLSH